jgi:hypothetical protein
VPEESEYSFWCSLGLNTYVSHPSLILLSRTGMELYLGVWWFVPLTVRSTGGYRVKKALFRVLNQIYRDYQFYWCCVFYLHDDMELDPYLWTETNITLLVDCRQEFLETCRIFTRQWRRHKWLSKLRQYGCKKNLLRRIICYTYCIWIFTPVSVNSSFSFLSFYYAEQSLMVTVKVS